MTGDCRADTDFRCLRIPRLADHDNIRILSQNGTESCFKSNPRLFIHLHLADPRKISLHRILDGHDIHRLFREIFQDHI